VAIVGFLLVSSTILVPAGRVEADGTMSTLRIGMVQSIDSLNPFIGVNDNSYIFYGLVYDYLICLDEDLNPKPNLAESWYVVPDYEPYGSVWQYNLTRDARWHDGERFTADDVVFTFEYQIGEKWLIMWAYQPYTLLIDHVEKVDDYTVRLFFGNAEGPVACSFGDGLMMPMVPKHYWKDISPSDAGFKHTNPKPLGSGAFMCTDQTYDEFLRGDRLILYKNPDYHGRQVNFDRLVLEFYLEPAAMLLDLQRGAIDIAQFDAPTFSSLEDWLDRNPTDKIDTYAGRKCTGYSVEIAISLKDSPATNPTRLDLAVRQAMAHATDKEFIVEHNYRGYAEKGATILSPVYPYWYWEPEPEEEYYYSIEKANEILDDAGYLWNEAHTHRYAPVGHPHNLGDEPIWLTYEVIVEQEIIEDRATAMLIREEWAAIGIVLDIKYVTTSMWGTLVYGGEFEITLTYWSGDPDPNYLLFVQSTDSLDGWSENWYSSPYYDENYTESILEVDPEIRREYVINCQRHMYHDIGFIVTAYPFETTAWRTDTFTGWGDWDSHPGRSLSNFWTANDLYFDLEPISTNEPPFVILDNVAGPAGHSLEVTAYAKDPEGDALEYLLDFGDGSNMSGDVPSDGEISAAHTYAASGEYTMNITVSDETGASRQSTSAVIVGPGENAPPSNIRVKPSSIKGEVDSEMTLVISGKDYEGDPLELTLEFGDDTADHEADATGTAAGFEMEVAHTFDSEGDYAIVLSANDSQNVTAATVILTVVTPSGGLSTVALVLIVVVVVVAVAAVAAMAMRRRKKGPKEEEDVRLP